jgi:hypothetical protein
MTLNLNLQAYLEEHDGYDRDSAKELAAYARQILAQRDEGTMRPSMYDALARLAGILAAEAACAPE